MAKAEIVNTTITLPTTIKLTNKSANEIKFAPYKENFNTRLGAGESLVLDAETAGQVFYYLKQANGALEVELGASVEGATYNVCTPASVVITNNSDKAMNFVPYRENFQFEVAPKTSFTFNAKTAGQAIYYMNQDVDGILDVMVGGKAVGDKN